MRGGGIVTVYRLGWVGLLALAVVVTIWLAFGRQVALVAPEDVKPSIARSDEPEPEFREEPFAELTVDMYEPELSLSSDDGSLKLQIRAKQAEKNESGYALTDGVLQFAIEERSVLLLWVKDAAFTAATDTVVLSGSLVGRITGSNQDGDQDSDQGNYQYFEATRLTWDRREPVVRTDKVVYRTKNIDVNGERMALNLRTGEVNLEGKVEAGVGELKAGG